MRMEIRRYRKAGDIRQGLGVRSQELDPASSDSAATRFARAEGAPVLVCVWKVGEQVMREVGPDGKLIGWLRFCGVLRDRLNEEFGPFGEGEDGVAGKYMEVVTAYLGTFGLQHGGMRYLPGGRMQLLARKKDRALEVEVRDGVLWVGYGDPASPVGLRRD